MPRSQQALTLRQIAELARTSKSTVSRVLTNHPNVSDATRKRVLGVIAKHHFRPNLFARGLAGGKTGLIGVITTEINSGFFAEVLRGVDAVVGQHGGHVLSSFAHGTDDYIRLWMDMATGRRVDGIVLVAPPRRVLERDIQSAEPPVVLCACQTQRTEAGWGAVDAVVVNNRESYGEILRHLYERGRRKLLFMAGPDDVWDAQERLQAVQAFASEHADMVVETLGGAMTYEDGIRIAQTFFDRSAFKPDAILATNDRQALGAMEVLRDRHVSVPDEVAVAGCDDDDASRLVGLTTLRMPMMDLGREAAGLLFERVEGHRPDEPRVVRVLPMTLQVRKSTTSI